MAHWLEWPKPLRTRQPEALAALKERAADELGFWAFVQFQFSRQWQALKAYANRGKSTPPAASVYRTVEINGYRCSICGYVYEGESLPADFRCPLCKAPAEKFEKIEK